MSVRHRFILFKAFGMLLLVFVLTIVGCESEEAEPNHWTALEVPDFGTLVDAQFINSNTGIILGQNREGTNIIIKTNDGGITWNKIDLLEETPEGNLRKIRLNPFSPNEIYTGNQNIYKSTNGGELWEQLGEFPCPENIIFFDALNGITADFRIRKSNDSGQTWRLVTENINAYPDLSQFTSNRIGYIAGGVDAHGWSIGGMAKTLDGGLSWTPVDYGFSRVTGMCFVDDNTGYITTYVTEGENLANLMTGYSLLVTTDGGTTWNTVENKIKEKYGEFARVSFFKNLNEGFLSTNLGIYKTSNGGHQWTKELNGFYQTYFTSDGTGFAIDRESGEVFKRTLPEVMP